MRFLTPEIGKFPLRFPGGGGGGRFRRRSDGVSDVDGRGADGVGRRHWTWSCSRRGAGLVAPAPPLKRRRGGQRLALWLSLSFVLLRGKQATVLLLVSQLHHTP